MQNSVDLIDEPAMLEILKEVAKKLIDEVAMAGYVNPELDCKIKVDDGRVFRLKFERVDLD